MIIILTLGWKALVFYLIFFTRKKSVFKFIFSDLDLDFSYTFSLIKYLDNKAMLIIIYSCFFCKLIISASWLMSYTMHRSGRNRDLMLSRRPTTGAAAESPGLLPHRHPSHRQDVLPLGGALHGLCPLPAGAKTWVQLWTSRTGTVVKQEQNKQWKDNL